MNPVSAFEPIRPVYGLPTPDVVGATNQVNQALQNATGHIQANRRLQAQMDHESKMAGMEALQQGITHMGQAFQYSAEKQKDRDHERRMQEERFRLYREKEEADRKYLEERQREMAELESITADYENRVSREMKQYPAYALARHLNEAMAAEDQLINFGMLSFFTQAVRNSPTSKMKNAVMERLKSDSLPEAVKGAIQSAIEAGQAWQEQTAMSPFRASDPKLSAGREAVMNALNAVGPDGSTGLSNGLQGIAASLGPGLGRVAADYVQRMVDTFGTDTPPNPETMKLPLAQAFNTMEFLLDVDDTLRLFQNQDGLSPKDREGIIRARNQIALIEKNFTKSGAQLAAFNKQAYADEMDTMAKLLTGEATLQDAITKFRTTADQKRQLLKSIDLDALFKLRGETEDQANVLLRKLARTKSPDERLQIMAALDALLANARTQRDQVLSPLREQSAPQAAVVQPAETPMPETLDGNKVLKAME